MSDKAEAFKEVCAYFGGAIYFAQVLEHGIANALLYLDFIPRTRGKWTSEEYDAYFDQNFEKTLGNLIRTLKGVTSLPASLEDALKESKDKRAFLAHHFFRERVDAFELGKHNEIIKELEDYRDFFESTDKTLQAFVKPIAERLGFTEAWYKEALQAYGNHIRQRP